MEQLHHLRIATRESQLAIRQTELVKEALLRYQPQMTIELVSMVTSGDKLLEHPLATAGGKGMFVKELEIALLENRADIAVHSMKDMPVSCAEGLEIAVYLERDDPRDVFVSNHYNQVKELPKNAKVGTASLRRGAIIKHQRPDVNIELLRGNVNTRLKKLDEGNYDAIILAAAGLHRLGLDSRINYYFSPEESLPAIGQGIIGVECRTNDKAIKKLLMPLDHYPTRLCTTAERAMNHKLGGNCHSPIAGYATVTGEILHLRGWVASIDGKKIIKAEKSGDCKKAATIGETVAADLIHQGANFILS
jgi:hydroxymethylbilane synthase